MILLVGAVGIEPTTFGLKGRCSTTELRPYRVTAQQLARKVPERQLDWCHLWGHLTLALTPPREACSDPGARNVSSSSNSCDPAGPQYLRAERLSSSSGSRTYAP